jgi:hypothetical protein
MLMRKRPTNGWAFFASIRPKPKHSSYVQRVRREMEVWAALKHLNICELLGYSTKLDYYPALILKACFGYFVIMFLTKVLEQWCKHGNSIEYLDNTDLSVQARVRLVGECLIMPLYQLTIHRRRMSAKEFNIYTNSRWYSET